MQDFQPKQRKTVRFTFDIDVELHKLLKVLSALGDRTMTDVIDEAIKEKLERMDLTGIKALEEPHE